MSDNPLLEPIHGITLEDYSAACAKMGSGLSEADIAKALGVEVPVWQEANLLWPERMKQDETFHIVTLFGQYFGQADQHPKFSNLKAAVSAEGGANTDRIKSDKRFYEELEVARQVAYEYGLDGAQWIADKYGITLGDFQIAASNWNAQIHQDIAADFDGYNERQAAYRAKYQQLFADAQGGNVADDIEF
ncbi:hypothetical protein HGH93_05490 [Chitinophaga polysaccharea]|uniref:DUF6620 family protein n=1 Tax=Chitinophaga TaxID=79328 RepID=UPI0014550CB0|nr:MULTISPECIES: DUF6620 family protein [Chitinophaga]NLR57540.1 hypothetical protein [Chitinophaga polysaccharea]NLU95454.1 hypothetical protein [Chitinophaga sp. Ak27]